MHFRTHVGAAIGGVCTFLVLTLIVAGAGVVIAARGGASLATIDLAAAVHDIPIWFKLLASGAAGASGGYLAARIAREYTALVGAWSVWCLVLVAVYARGRGVTSAPLAQEIATLAIALSAGVGGGYVAGRRASGSVVAPHTQL